MNPPVICRCCEMPTEDVSRRFDAALGAVCPDCYEASQTADAALRKVGIEGMTHEP